MAKSASDVDAGPAKVVVRTDTTDPKKIAAAKPAGIATSQGEDPASFNAADKRWPGTVHPPGALRCIHDCAFMSVKRAGKRRITKQTPFKVGELVHVGHQWYAQASKSPCFEFCKDDITAALKAASPADG